jgi:hypothetical protein
MEPYVHTATRFCDVGCLVDFPIPLKLLCSGLDVAVMRGHVTVPSAGIYGPRLRVCSN